MKPTETGLWLVKSFELGDWKPIIITKSERGLIVNDFYLGPMLLDEFHSRMIDIQWKRPQINLEGQL